MNYINLDADCLDYIFLRMVLNVPLLWLWLDFAQTDAGCFVQVPQTTRCTTHARGSTARRRWPLWRPTTTRAPSEAGCRSFFTPWDSTKHQKRRLSDRPCYYTLWCKGLAGNFLSMIDQQLLLAWPRKLKAGFFPTGEQGLTVTVCVCVCVCVCDRERVARSTHPSGQLVRPQPKNVLRGGGGGRGRPF